MQTITLLVPEGEETCTVHRRVADALQGIEDMPGRLYYTHAPNFKIDALDLEFVTTHKDTHLKLGCLQLDELHSLGELFEELFDHGALREVFVALGGGSSIVWYVVRTQDGHCVTYHLSPAR